MNRLAGKIRLDQLLADLRPDLSRSRIQAEIMAGNVLVNGLVFDKPGTIIDDRVTIVLREPENPYVGRGGLKINGALCDLNINVENMVVLDVGASTGGFTDCLLKRGARHIYALDVGYGQLDLTLRNDSRVTVMERFNVRRLECQDLPLIPDLAVVDVSFISLSKVLPVLVKFPIPFILALIKPQFEVGRVDAGKGKGVIRDPALHRCVLKEIASFACKTGYCYRGITYSKWPGPKGNIEYFIYLKADAVDKNSGIPLYDDAIIETVERAHRELNKNNK